MTRERPDVSGGHTCLQQAGRVEERSVGPPPGHLAHLTTGAKGCLQSDLFLSAGMEAPSPCCERQDQQLDFDFQLCEASGWWGGADHRELQLHLLSGTEGPGRPQQFSPPGN